MPLMGQYEYIIDKNHPHANAEGQVYVHIIEAEKLLNRPLKDNETVHHQDLNKTNNDPKNLMVFTSKAEHTSYHNHNFDNTYLIQNDDNTYSYKMHRKQNYCIECGVKISLRAKRCSTCQLALSSIPSKDELVDLLYETNGNFSYIGRKFKVSSTTIHHWCKKYKIPSHSCDYKTVKKQSSKNKIQYKIYQIDNITGNIINTYNSFIEAEKVTGITHISDVCHNKRKSAGGYLWKQILL